MKLGTLLLTTDFVLRAAFFALAPFAVVFMAQLFPVTGAVLQVLLALAVFFASETLRARATKSWLGRQLLSTQLEFDAYYRAHRPRPFLYYVFYPLLFPYWLWMPAARREFLLYKGYTLASFALLVASLGVQFVRAFPPELSLRDFVPIAGGTLLAEAVVVLMFLMPIVTTIVHLHHERAPRRLAALLGIALVSIGVATVRLERRRDPIVSYATRQRVRLRTKAAPYSATAAQKAALRAAWRALPKNRQDLDADGKVVDVPLEAAQQALMPFYKNDEAHAFDLWYTHKNRHGMMVLYFEARQHHEPIWLAMNHKRELTHDVAQLPANAFTAMRRAAN